MLVNDVGVAGLEVDGSTVQGLVGGKGGHSSDAEILVGSAAQVAYDMGRTGCNDVPVFEVAGTVEDCFDITAMEEATLEECVDRFEGIAIAEFNRTCDEKALAYSLVGG